MKKKYIKKTNFFWLVNTKEENILIENTCSVGGEIKMECSSEEGNSRALLWR